MENYCKYRSIKYLDSKDIDNRLKHLYKGMCYLLGQSGGSQNLQQVTNNGNSTTNDIFVTVDGSTPASHGLVALDGNVGTGLSIGVANNEPIITMQPPTSVGSSTTIHSNFTGANRNLYFPDGSGTLLLSVNGEVADDEGNVVISAATGSFTTVDLKTVTVVNGIITSIV